MHRNTYLLILVLATIATLVVGVNLGKKFRTPNVTSVPTVTVAPSDMPLASLAIAGASGVPRTSVGPKKDTTSVVVENASCGFTFSYAPSGFAILDDGAGSMQLTNKTNNADVIIITCQKDIPRPALTEADIEHKTISGVPVFLYHDSSPKDGKPIDALIFTHPTKKIDVFIAGYGASFNTLISTVTIVQ